MGIVSWLNQNQGFVMAMLTLVYVVATVAIALIMVRSNRLSRGSLTQALELERRRSRPYVVFTIEIRRYVVMAVLRNIGLTAAYRVKLRLSPKLQRAIRNELNDSPLAAGEIAFLPPTGTLEDFIDVADSFFKRYPESIFRGEISYEDREGKPYSETVSLDLAVENDLNNLVEKDVGRELEKLTKVVTNIGRMLARQMNRPARPS